MKRRDQSRIYAVPDKDRKLAMETWNRFIALKDAHKDYVKRALLNDDYYAGKQWLDSDVEDLDEEGRPHLTINMIMSTVNAFIREQQKTRADIKFKPTTPQHDKTADTLTKLFKIEYNRCRYKWVETQVVMDGLVQERGYFDVRMDFSNNINGRLKITSMDPTEVLPDPDAKDYDPRTWKDVITTRWVSIDDIDETYGRKYAKRLESLVDTGNFFKQDSIEFGHDEESHTFGDGGLTDITHSREVGIDDPKQMRSVRIIERQHRKLKRVLTYVDPATGDAKDAPVDWSETEVKRFAKRFGLEVLDRVVSRVRWTVTCDHVTLHDDWSPYDDFTIVPYFPLFRRGRPIGLVTNLLSPQDQLNKLESQMLHVVNSTANGGYMVETGSLANMSTSDLERNGSKTGVVIEYNRGSSKPEKIQPNNIPQGLDRLSNRALNSIREISGANAAVLGTDKPSVSGVALEEKSDAGKELLNVPLDTLDMTRHILAEVSLGMIQRFYTDERIFYMVNEDDPAAESEDIRVNEVQPDGTVVNDISLGSYDIAISTVPNRDTFNDMQFAEALNLRKIGVAVPDDVVVMYSNLTGRRDLAKRLRLEQGIDQTPEQQQLMQIQNEIAMQEAQKRLMELDAKIEELMSRANKQNAEAEAIGAKPSLEMQRLMDEREMRQREIDLRDRLAQLSNLSKDNAVQVSSAAKLAQTAIQAGMKPQEPTSKKE